MKLTEPVTAITDHILGIELFIFSFLLFQQNNSQSSIMLWSISFLLIGLAAITGGVFHGNRVSLPESLIWKLPKFIVGFAVCAFALMIVAGIVTTSGGTFRWLLVAATLISFLYGIAKISKKGTAKSNYFPLLAGLSCFFALFLIYEFLSDGPLIGRWILGGTLLVLIAGAVQQRGIQLHEHFNHNDLCHVILIGAMYMLYRGGLLLRDH